MTEPSRIIGVLDDGPAGLTPGAMRRIAEADLVIGASRTLALFSETLGDKTERHDLTGNLAQVPQWIADAREAQRQVVVLATGDPLCHGIAAYLIGKLGHETFEVIPNVSTLQWAFARLGLAWHEARIASVHSSDAGEWTPGAGSEHGMYGVLQQLRQTRLLAVFTSPENSPDRIARMLQAESLADEYEMAVAECLLQPTEKVSTWLAIDDAADRRYADPNVVILRKLGVGARASRPQTAHRASELPLFGLPDHRFQQRAPDKGLITKREVRAVSLARLGLCPDSIVWDIGAGSGAVGLEAARLCPQGHIYAIEKNEADFAIAWSNRASLRVTNYSLVHGRAPAGLERWPDPDAIFIGGSGGELRELIQLCLEKLRPGGNLVMNFATLENLSTAVETLKVCGADWDVVQLQASRSRPILDMHRMQAENPIWIVSATTGERDARGPTGPRTSCPPHKHWYSRGYLPHYDTPGLLQSVTFRLADALPTQALEGLMRESEDDVERHRRIEALLDAGHGACWLKQPKIADIVEDALLHGDGERYRLLAWCVMPNHVHVLIETRDGWPLPGVLHSWKSFTAKSINRHLGRTGTVWMPDYFDRYIRDDYHLAVVIAYIHANPVEAGLVENESQWPHSSASFNPNNGGQDVRGPIIGARTSCPPNKQT